MQPPTTAPEKEDIAEKEKDEDIVAISDTERGDDGVGKISHDEATAETTETARVIDKTAERHLCQKFDFRLLPVLAVMCK